MYRSQCMFWHTVIWALSGSTTCDTVAPLRIVMCIQKGVSWTCLTLEVWPAWCQDDCSPGVCTQVMKLHLLLCCPARSPSVCYYDTLPMTACLAGIPSMLKLWHLCDDIPSVAGLIGCSAMGTRLDISCNGYAKTDKDSSTMVHMVALWLIDPGTNPAKSTTSELLWTLGLRATYAQWTAPSDWPTTVCNNFWCPLWLSSGAVNFVPAKGMGWEVAQYCS